MAFASILQGDAESVLASVNDFLRIEKESDSLEIAYRFIASRKKTPWSHDYEKLMMFNIDLALKLGRPDYITENLLHFRNNAQSGHVSSVETVFSHFLVRMEENFQKSLDEVSGREEMFQEINEQDDAQTFYFNLLNTEEGKSKERFKNSWRLLVSAYRTVLDLTSKTTRLEDIYVKTARRVFQNLFDYKAHRDFKAFCVLIKAHQQAIVAKGETAQTSAQTKNLSNYETNRKMLDLRRFQLDLCKKLDFMQEAFLVLEDLNTLLLLSRKRGEFYVEYYQNLALIFFKGGFQFFHAIALSKAFSYLIKLKVESSVIEQEASKMVLAVLSINSKSEEFFLPDSLIEKYEVLLGFSGQRKTMNYLHEEITKSVLMFCPAHIKALYRVCTGQNDLYDFSNDITLYMKSVGEEFEVYKKLITENCVYTILRLVSKFYSNITFAELKDFTHFIEFDQVKQIIQKSKFDKQINAYLNYENEILEFLDNEFNLDIALDTLQSFTQKLERINFLLKSKRRRDQQAPNNEDELKKQLLDLFKNAENAIKEKEALIAKDVSMLPKEALTKKKHGRKEVDQEEELRRAHIKKEQEKQMIIERKMLQVKKTKVKELLKLNPTILVLKTPLINFTDEEIAKLDYSIFIEIEEDLEAQRTEASNKLLEKKYKIYDFYQRELFKVYDENIKKRNTETEIDKSKIEVQIKEINDKKQQLGNIVNNAKKFTELFRNRKSKQKEDLFDKEMIQYKNDLTEKYKEMLLAEANKAFNKMKEAQNLQKPYARGSLIPSSGTQGPPSNFNEPPKITTLTRGTGFVKQEEPLARPGVPKQPVQIAKRGEGLLPQKQPEPLKPLEKREMKRETNPEVLRKTEPAKPKEVIKLERQQAPVQGKMMRPGFGSEKAKEKDPEKEKGKDQERDKIPEKEKEKEQEADKNKEKEKPLKQEEKPRQRGRRGFGE